jgi:hypothetical protein
VIEVLRVFDSLRCRAWPGFCFAKTTLTSGEVADSSVASSGAGRPINGDRRARLARCTMLRNLRTACKTPEV